MDCQRREDRLGVLHIDQQRQPRQAGLSGVDAANPRVENTMGNIIRWKEDGDFAATTFAWNHFVMAGNPVLDRADAKGNVKGDQPGSPDGLWVDGRGVLWIETDISTSTLGRAITLPRQTTACTRQTRRRVKSAAFWWVRVAANSLASS